MPFSATIDPEDPRSVSDSLLDKTRAAYLTNDFEAFRECFALPHLLETFAGQRILTDLADFRKTYEAMRAFMRDIGVIDMKRRTIEARFVSETRIDATSIAEYILGGYQVSDEVVCRSALIHTEAGWQISESRYATKIATVSRVLVPG